MARIAFALAIPLAALLLVAGSWQERHRREHLDASRAFYYPAFAKNAPTTVVETDAGPIVASTYLRYLASRIGTRHLEDLAFDFLLARECEARRVVRNAPMLARVTGMKRFLESGRSTKGDADGSQRRKFVNAALRRLRVDALASVDRAADAGGLRSLFNRRYGVGGHRVRVRQVLVSFTATRRRLEATGNNPDEATVVAAARERVGSIRDRARAEFGELLRESDDRTTRALLRRGDDQAGFLAGYNYRRYGSVFADAVRRLEVGQTSSPVQTAVGFHLIELVERKVTRFADVTAALRAELARGAATPAEIRGLRRALLARYHVRMK